MRFTKMHGLGNDYVYINGYEQAVADPRQLAIDVSDRHTGIGADGLILILPSDKADVRMRMFNADGSEAEMCGNGVRCVAKFAFDHGLSSNNPLRVETGRGVLNLNLAVHDKKVAQVTVDMGKPILHLADIPVDANRLKPCTRQEAFVLEIDGSPTEMVFVSVGNPHACIFVNNVAAIDIARLGPMIENHPAFPRRINVHWVQANHLQDVTMRTWERGSGITQACGTGACAVGVAAALSGLCDRTITAHLPGGDLKLEWREIDDHIHMTGPAVEVFSGEWE